MIFRSDTINSLKFTKILRNTQQKIVIKTSCSKQQQKLKFFWEKAVVSPKVQQKDRRQQRMSALRCGSTAAAAAGVQVVS